MSEQPVSSEVNSEITSDDKLWALLAYVFSPLVPVIILLMEDKKNRPFLRAHNAQALAVGAVNVAIAVFLWWLIFPICANILLYMPLAYLLAAASAANTWSAGGRALRIVAELIGCAALAVGVEFLQLFFPPRTVSLNDRRPNSEPWGQSSNCSSGRL